MLLKFTTIALIPAIALQGYLVKKNTLRLMEPSGEREGVIGQGKELSLLILGDSAAAGVGVEFQQDALLGNILRKLKDHFKIQYTLHAKTGHTTPQVIKSISNLPQVHYDVVVTSVGVNDVTKFSSPSAWLKQQEQLYQLISKKFSPNLVIAACVPPMQLFPALPNPLGWLLGQYAKQMNQKLRKFAFNKENMLLIEYDVEHYQALNIEMAADGFHPSKAVYDIWATQVVDKIQHRFKM